MLLSRTSSMCANYCSRFSSKKTRPKKKKNPLKCTRCLLSPASHKHWYYDWSSLKSAQTSIESSAKGAPVWTMSPMRLPAHRERATECPSSAYKSVNWLILYNPFKISNHEIFMLNPPPPQPFNQDKQNNNMKKQAAEETGLICTLMNIIPFQQMHLFGLLRSPSKWGFSVALALNWSLVKTN